MAQVPFTSFYLGPFGVYTSPTGMASPTTGTPYLGGTLHSGDYCDLTDAEAAIWNVQFGAKLYPGRYRLVRVSTGSTYSTIKYGYPVGWGNPTSLSAVAITAVGSGSGTGTVLCASTAAGGTAATANVTVSAGVITGVQLVYAGAGFTSVPTFALTEIATAGITTTGTVAGLMAVIPNLVGSFDTTGSVAISSVRGVAIVTSITAAQIAAGAWIVIQESGVAPVYVTTATGTTIGNYLWSATAGAVTSNTPAWYIATLGWSVDTITATEIVRCVLTLPPVQG